MATQDEESARLRLSTNDVTRPRWDDFVRRNEERAWELGITEADVPRVIQELRKELRRDSPDAK